jgi:Zn-dependent M28 family amino/carboxypeptidase
MGNPWLGQANRIQNLAAAAGAVASIVLLDDTFDAEAMIALNERFAAPVWRMGWELPPVQVAMRQSDALQLFPALEGTLNGSRSETAGIPLDGKLSGLLPADILVDGRPPNVIAMIQGSDPALRDEFVVLSAHFDHVGIGTPIEGDSIYNGADDNGSGTVALLEVANAISQMPEAPRRSIAFVHISGEEKGLLGASWFVDHATIPVEQMIANINADMIGGDAHKDSLVVIGKTYSTLGPLVDEINDSMPELRLITSDDIWPEQRFFFRSDQYHFMRKEIPSLFFFTGVHECYHRPCDTPEFVNSEKASRVARLLTHVTLEIANQDARPVWDPDGLAEVRALISGGR